MSSRWRQSTGLHGQAVKRLPALVVVVALSVAACTVRSGLEVDDAADGEFLAPAENVFLQGYPPPPATKAAPTATPPPVDGYYPEPRGIHYDVMSLGSSPYSRLLVPLQASYDHDPVSAADWATGGLFPVFSLNPLLDDAHGGNIYLEPQDVRSVLGVFAANGSDLVIQGYFDVTEDEEGEPTAPQLWVVVTGFEGQVSFPTPPPSEGEWEPLPVPGNIETAAALWYFWPDESPDDWIWSDWMTGPGYYEVLNFCSREIHDGIGAPLGTYHVLRR